MNLLLAALGCQRGPVPLSPPAGPRPAEMLTAPASRPTLASPAEAVDLDPDPDILHVEITAAPLRFEVGDLSLDGWAYNGQVPGPTLRARLGETVIVDFHNDLPDPTTVHWHGLDVPAAMDGAGLPMPEIPPGGSFTYTFAVQQAGTFWYHPHFDTEHQVDRGLYGVFIVEDEGDPAPDDELVLVLDTFGEPEASEEDPHMVDATRERWAVNGLVDPVFAAEGGSVVRVRLLDASNTGYVDLPNQTVIARDQGILAAPQDGVTLAPGDRAEIEWRVGEGFDILHSPFVVAGGAALGETSRLLSVVVDAPAAEPPSLPWPFSGQPPSADPGTTDLRFLLTGSPELGWEMNGETFPDVTIPSLSLGEEVILEVRNVSPAHHPFHIHGHTFEVLSLDGLAPPHRLVEDTVDVPIYGVLRLRMIADNPGMWMTHCHILPHAEGGMMTLLDVR